MRKKHGLFKMMVTAAVLCGALLADSNLRVVTTEYTLRYSTLPREFDGLRIVQLSDIHGGVWGRDNAVLLKRVREARPDLIALTEYVREYLNKDKVYLMGHSYGTYLGTLAANEKPEYYKAYIGVGGETEGEAEATYPTIYIYDCKTGAVEKGVELSKGFCFDIIRAMDAE